MNLIRVFFIFYAVCLSQRLNVWSFLVKNPHKGWKIRVSLNQLAKLNAEDIEKYKRIQQLVKLKEQGLSYEQIKEMAANGTVTLPSPAQKKKGSRRSFEQRLRTIVGMKADSVTSRVSSSGSMDSISSNMKFEEQDLEEVMNDDSYDEDVPSDEEEMLYEQIVLEIMEEESLKEIEDNFILQKDLENIRSQAQNTTLPHEISSNKHNNTITDNSATLNEDLYTPKVSTWGVFPRPKNISQAYGGGRVINSQEVELQLSKGRSNDDFIPNTQSKLQKESSYRTEIEEALKKARVFMYRGYPKSSIETLESVREYLLWETEFSGEVWLELGMAYETLYQLDEARAIYNKILASNWSQKNRKNASLLLSGLDIAKKVNKKLSEGQEDAVKAFNSFSNSDVFNEVMDKAVYSSWDSYKRDTNRRSSSSSSSYGIDKTVAERLANYNYTTVEEAYLALLIEIQPLQEVKLEILLKAINKMNEANEEEKYEFIGNKEYRFRDDDSFQLNTIISALKSANQRQSLLEEREKAKQRFSYSVKTANDLIPFMNGSWELVTSLSLSRPNQLKRYELGENRRYINIFSNDCSEIFPSFLGLSTSTVNYHCQFDAEKKEIIFTGEGVKKSASPWLEKRRTTQTAQVRVHFVKYFFVD